MAKRIRPPMILPAITAFMAIGVAVLTQKINELNADVRSQAASQTPSPSCSPVPSKTVTFLDRCTTNTYKQASVICKNDKRTTIHQTTCATKDQLKVLADNYCQTTTNCK